MQELKDVISQLLATQSKDGEQLVSMMPAIKKSFDPMGDDKKKLSTESESLNNQIGFNDEKWFQESKGKPLSQLHDDERPILIMSRLGKQMRKQFLNGFY